MFFNARLNKLAYWGTGTNSAVREFDLNSFSATNTVLPIKTFQLIKDDIGYSVGSQKINYCDIKTGAVIKSDNGTAYNHVLSLSDYGSSAQSKYYTISTNSITANDVALYAVTKVGYYRDSLRKSIRAVFTKQDQSTFAILKTLDRSVSTSTHSGLFLIAATNSNLFWLQALSKTSYNQYLRKLDQNTFADIKSYTITIDDAYYTNPNGYVATENNLYFAGQTSVSSDYTAIREINTSTLAQIRVSRTIYDLNRINIMAIW